MQFLIDSKTYPLSKNNFYQTNYKKYQIVLGNSFSTKMDHYAGWKNRHSGHYKKTAPFTVALSGRIYQHYDPIHSSEFIGNGMDKYIIPVVIENEGWLLYDAKNDSYKSCYGNIYNRSDDIVEKRWRNFAYWAPYGKKQLESTIELMRYISDRFNIPIKVMGNNTRNDYVSEYEGIVYRANYARYFTDLNPAWNFNQFKNKLELN